MSTAEATTTAVGSSLNPSTYGVNVTLTATVSAAVGTPTGTVQFEVDGVNLGSAQTLVGGVASIGTSSLPADTHVITAHYTSDDPVNFANGSGTLPGGQVVDKADQATLTITGPASATYGAADLTITTAGGSGSGAVTFDAGTSSACSIVANKLHVLSGTGTCSVTATKAADANYNAETSAPFSVTVDKAAQATLTITGPASATYGAADLTITTAGGSGSGAVTFDAGSSSACSIVANKLHVLSGTGTCSVTATKAADANYDAETSAPFSVTVDKADQATLTVIASSPAVYGSVQTLTTSGGSGTGAVTYSDGSSTACSVSGDELAITAGTGSCSVTATKAADANFNVTTSVAEPIAVQKADQATLTITGPATRTYGDAPFSPSFTGGAGTGTVTFTSSTTAICTASSSATVTIVTAGTCSVTATKAADANYNAETSAPYSVTVDKAAQATLTITGPASATYGAADLTITTAGGSGSGAVTFDAGTSSACSIVANKLHVLSGTGTCSVTATKAADANYDAETSAPFSVTVQKAAQAVLAVVVTSPAPYGSVETLTTTGGSGTGAVTYSTGPSTACSVSGNQLTILASVGTCAVTATKAADANYNVRSSAPASITVQKAATTVTLASDNAPSVYGENVTFTATVSPVAPGAGVPTGTVQFRIDALDAGLPVTLSGGTATFSTSALAAGSHLGVQAIYGGDASFVGDTGTLGGGQAVAKKTLTVTADPVSRGYGAPNPTLTASYAGFVLGDTFGSSVTGSPVLATTATPASTVLGGPYPITVDLGSLAAANYDFTPFDGLLSVLPATTTVTLTSTVNPAPPTQPVRLTARVTGLPTPGGTIDFQEWNGSTFSTLESALLSTGFTASTATITLPATEGEIQYRAVFASPDTNYANATGPLVQVIGKSPVTVTLKASRTKWESTVPIVFTATITPDATNATVAVTGKVDFSVGGGAVVSVPVASGKAVLPARTLQVGTSPVVTAVYSGNGSYRTGAAAPLSRPVTANIVEATSVAVSGTTIYPYKDTWRDTVAIRGTRTERLSVTIRIYKPTGSLLTTRSIAAGTGAYSSTWNGRYSSGTLLPAGKYRVVQTLSDPSSVPALAKSWTAYVTLSSKKMTWHTVSVYRNANAPSAWSGAPSLLSSSKYTTGARLITPTSEAGGWAAFAYQFTLPSASTIKSVAFYVQGGPWSGGTPSTPPKIGLHDWRRGTSWLLMYDAARTRRSVGTSTSTWYGIGGDPAVVVKSISGKRYVRAYVDTGSWVSGFRYELGKVRVVVTYGVLK